MKSLPEISIITEIGNNYKLSSEPSMIEIVIKVAVATSTSRECNAHF